MCVGVLMELYNTILNYVKIGKNTIYMFYLQK